MARKQEPRALQRISGARTELPHVASKSVPVQHLVHEYHNLIFALNITTLLFTTNNPICICKLFLLFALK